MLAALFLPESSASLQTTGRRRITSTSHVVLGRRDGSTRGGRLLWARVRPTLEVIVTESAGFLRRVHDPVTGLALIRLPK